MSDTVSLPEGGRRGPDPGSRILHYRIVGELGRGGMGAVYRAEDEKLRREVALKVLSPEMVSDPERLARFRREARAVAALNHPNIVTIHSVDVAEGHHFLTMELVEGETLGDRIPPHGMPLKELLDLAIPMADAVAAAHERKITHRDLKPDNVMVDGKGRVKILDFGLAKRVGEAAGGEGALPSIPLTGEGLILGTVPYMSPEQLEGRPVDGRSDIFSLGVILYQMAAGERPFRGDNTAALMSAILRDAPEPLTALRDDLPRHLGRIIALCLEKNPADRYQSALDVRNELRQLRKEIESGETPASSGAAAGSSDRPAEAGSGRRPSAGRTPASGVPAVAIRGRAGPTLLLGLVFGVNWVETWLETVARPEGPVTALGYTIARSMHRLEGLVSFRGHDLVPTLAVYGFSISYFFVLPALALGTALALARRPALAPYRVFAQAVAFTYGLSLPFFLFFPVPERWAYPDSGAILLSDLWTSRLIEVFRPISGLDNCFPSFHVSLTVVIVATAFLFRLRLRWSTAALGGTVVLATYALGIHWLADIAAGIAAGVLGTAAAVRWGRRPITRGRADGGAARRRPGSAASSRSSSARSASPGW